ncbi:MAG: hypothetical protein K2X82_33450 [Gemmataceae bacterium]|nr:hypothetical protein [Gemmataceae bacterium]
MPGPRRRVRPPVRAAAVAALLAGCAGLPAQPQETTVYLVLRTGPDETEKGILATLRQGLDKSGATIAGEPTIKAVSPAFFEEFQAVVDRAGPPAAAADEGVSIRLLPTREAIYEIKLQPTQVLKKLRVTYQKGGQKDYAPAAPGTDKAALVLTVPGRYAFTPEPDDVPLSYDGDVAELGKPAATVKGDWPKGDKFFVVTMRNFRGNRQRLFDVIADPKMVANPLDNVQLGNDLLFAFASLNSSAADPGDDGLDSENNLSMTVESIARRNPRRVWVLFPLDEAGMREARDKYRKLSSTELPEAIRADAVKAAEAAAVGPGTGPRWYELPPEPTPAGEPPRRFVRKVKLDDVAGLAEKYPQLWTLVVWEFDSGNDRPEAIQVKHPKDDRVYVLERERPGWQKVVQKVKPPAKK